MPSEASCAALGGGGHCVYGEIGGLGFNANFWGLISVLGDAAMLLGSYIYGAYLTATPLRLLFLVLQLFNAAASTFNLILAVSASSVLSAKWIAPIGNIAFWLAWQLKVLPIFTLSAKIVPTGVEATLMSIISSTNDLGGTAAKYLGAVITQWLGIDEIPGSACDGSPCLDFSNLWVLYLISVGLTVLPIVFIPLVPSDKKISEVVAAVDNYTAEEAADGSDAMMADGGAAAAASGGGTGQGDDSPTLQAKRGASDLKAPLLAGSE